MKGLFTRLDWKKNSMSFHYGCSFFVHRYCDPLLVMKVDFGIDGYQKLGGT